ncbi:ABC transporter ATP-binding protein [Halodesulfovibrio marinisediminis]|uniref:Iron(III) transport system ATP-binding protein n=1 Tax=Halodesulfovibrio marinisediminis DSM 17456 TaxID=1121457 RepID=A0A1N6DW29_9BACT|nr:ABC transporter ATP-binding protein [Halodesulfovibrio marinisediminis]SIN74913.1 iron(III) transport system ATP-binding protein [Halodesulfovibrio marinisediminis DSM 17456]
MLNITFVQKHFDKKRVLSDVSLSLPKGQIGCLLGASGCGKTTLLRIIAGFETIDSGEVRINDTVMSSKKSILSPEDRKIGMVFQDYALFPHMTVKENIAFGLQRKKKSLFSASLTSADKKRVDEMLCLVGLSESTNKYPHQLSGGQQQRVALARALAPKPKLLLLDEPFSNLDVTLREHLSVEMRSIIKKEGITAVMVTHNQSEAFAMGDLIGIMNEGELHQWDTPETIYNSPATPFVSTFIGEGTLIKGERKEAFIHTALGSFSEDSVTFFTSSDEGMMLVRPEKLNISPDLPDIKNAVQGTVEQIVFKGGYHSCVIRLSSNETITVNTPTDTKLILNAAVSIHYRHNH